MAALVSADTRSLYAAVRALSNCPRSGWRGSDGSLSWARTPPAIWSTCRVQYCNEEQVPYLAGRSQRHPIDELFNARFADTYSRVLSRT